jgi:hypothetical protein
LFTSLLRRKPPLVGIRERTAGSIGSVAERAEGNRECLTACQVATGRVPKHAAQRTEFCWTSVPRSNCRVGDLTISRDVQLELPSRPNWQRMCTSTRNCRTSQPPDFGPLSQSGVALFTLLVERRAVLTRPVSHAIVCNIVKLGFLRQEVRPSACKTLPQGRVKTLHPTQRANASTDRERAVILREVDGNAWSFDRGQPGPRGGGSAVHLSAAT